MEEKKVLIIKFLFVLLFGVAIGYAIGYGMGMNFAINLAVEKGVYFLHMQGYELTMDIDKISNLLAVYNTKVGGDYALIHNNTGN